MCDWPCKTANDESLARDEGGGRTPPLRGGDVQDRTRVFTAHDTGDGKFSVSHYQQTGIDDFDIRRGCGDVRSRCR